MHTTELRHRVVAVLDEHLLVELLGPLQSDRRVDRRVARDVELADELVEEEPAQALGRSRVAGEERPLDHLGQVDQGEDRLVEIGDVAPEDDLLVRGEALFGVGEHARVTIEPGCVSSGGWAGPRTRAGAMVPGWRRTLLPAPCGGP